MKKIITLIPLLLIVSTMLAQSPRARIHLNLEGKLALHGYDPVAYFNQKKAAKGRASIVTEYEGVRYQFSTETNKNVFLGSPHLYRPQYGGWCAYAMGAKGEKVEVDPETFKIVEGKLYLFYNRFFNNTLDSWNKNEVALKAMADMNWNEVIKR